jgi:hypothetical protein
MRRCGRRVKAVHIRGDSVWLRGVAASDSAKPAAARPALPPPGGAATAVATVTTLSLTRLRLLAVPEEVWELRRLRELCLAHNDLCLLPDHLASSLPALAVLRLDDNDFTAVPPSVCNATSLTVLSVSGNRVSSVPPELCQLVNLRELDVSRNMVRRVALCLGEGGWLDGRACLRACVIEEERERGVSERASE